MDTPFPSDLDERGLGAALAAGWDVAADTLRYLPKGAGSYHWVATVSGRPTWFVTVDDLDTKPWLGTGRDAAFTRLGDAYGAAWDLEHRARLEFVVGPLRAADRSVVVRFGDRYSIAVFPFVDGAAGEWGVPIPRADRRVLLGGLAALHRATSALDAPLGERPLDVAERPLLAAALGELDVEWDAGPFAEPARRALAHRADAVTGWLAELDDLARCLGDAGRAAVVTHGEPHPGNLIRTPAGVRLIDWDTVALALPERDLWMLDGGSADLLRRYEQDTGRDVDPAAVRFYGLAWRLSDIASFTGLFRAPHERTKRMESKWTGFLRLLGGAPSTPYGDPGRGG